MRVGDSNRRVRRGFFAMRSKHVRGCAIIPIRMKRLGKARLLHRALVAIRPLQLMLPIWVLFLFLAAFRIHEVTLTLIALLATLISLRICTVAERRLYVVGLLFGIIVEVVIANVDRAQHWENASLFGVPAWLPLIWGLAFVGINRIGYVLGTFSSIERAYPRADTAR